MTTPIDLTASDLSRFFSIHRTQARRLLSHYCDITQNVHLTTDDLDRLNRIIGLARSDKLVGNRYESAAAQVFKGVPGIPYVNIPWWGHYQSLKDHYTSSSVNLTDLWRVMVHYLRLDPDQSSAEFLKRAADVAARLSGGLSARHAMLDTLSEELRRAFEEVPDHDTQADAPDWYYTNTFTGVMKMRFLVNHLTLSAPTLPFGDQPVLLTPAETERLTSGFRAMPEFVLDECQAALEQGMALLQRWAAERILLLHQYLTQHHLLTLALITLESSRPNLDQSAHRQPRPNGKASREAFMTSAFTEDDTILLDLAQRLDDAVRSIQGSGPEHAAAFLEGQPPFAPMRAIFDDVRAKFSPGLRSVAPADVATLTADVTLFEELVIAWLNGLSTQAALPCPAARRLLTAPAVVTQEVSLQPELSERTANETPSAGLPESMTEPDVLVQPLVPELMPARWAGPQLPESASANVSDFTPASVLPARPITLPAPVLPADSLTAQTILTESQTLLTTCRQIEQRVSRSMHDADLKAQARQETQALFDRCAELEQLDAAADLSPEDLTSFLKVGQRIRDLLDALNS